MYCPTIIYLSLCLHDVLLRPYVGWWRRQPNYNCGCLFNFIINVRNFDMVIFITLKLARLEATIILRYIILLYYTKDRQIWKRNIEIYYNKHRFQLTTTVLDHKVATFFQDDFQLKERVLQVNVVTVTESAVLKQRENGKLTCLHKMF